MSIPFFGGYYMLWQSPKKWKREKIPTKVVIIFEGITIPYPHSRSSGSAAPRWRRQGHRCAWSQGSSGPPIPGDLPMINGYLIRKIWTIDKFLFMGYLVNGYVRILWRYNNNNWIFSLSSRHNIHNNKNSLIYWEYSTIWSSHKSSNIQESTMIFPWKSSHDLLVLNVGNGWVAGGCWDYYW